jgi:hypothetical protein
MDRGLPVPVPDLDKARFTTLIFTPARRGAGMSAAAADSAPTRHSLWHWQRRHLHDSELVGWPQRRSTRLTQLPVPAAATVTRKSLMARMTRRATCTSESQPKVCPTWVGGTEKFPVPPFSR